MSFHPKTLFIVGAGAGFSYQMPLGKDLAQTIRSAAAFKFDHQNVTRGDKGLFEAFRRAVPRESLNELVNGMRRIAGGISTADSIDTFMDRFSDDAWLVRAGKILIAYYILQAERNCSLRIDAAKRDSDIDFSGLPDNWLVRFSTMLFSEFHQSALDQIPERVNIICFNYDRCIERYMQEAVRQGFIVDQSRAYEIVNAMNIEHPYGRLGKLPPSPMGSSPDCVAFGADEDVDLSKLADGLRTFTEEIEDGPQLRRIRTMVGEAERIVFLGFAFHSPNMRLLTVPATGGRRRIYATGIGLSEQERDVIVTECLKMIGAGNQKSARELVNLGRGENCEQFLDVHRRNLLE